tara:strand:+ start:1813 stop:2217 length:405 start_codon:yes stop_codon:yes gene_type:complete
MTINKKTKLINPLYFAGLILVILVFFRTFSNSYIILKNDYNSRVVQNAGDCTNQGYGFIKRIYDKYGRIYYYNYNVINYNSAASANSYFYSIQKKDNLNYLILLNPSTEQLQNFLNRKHSIIEKIDNCYFIELK